MPAASEAVGSPGGGGGGGGGDVEPFEIRNDEGFVFKVPRGLYPDAAPSTTQPSAAGPDRKAAGLRRRRRALLRLRDKRLRDLSRWEALASELLAPLQAPEAPASVAAADSSSTPDAAASTCSAPDAAASSSSSGSILDALLQAVELQRELINKAREWCADANVVCDAEEAAIFDSVAPRLPLWGSNPLDLMAGLSSPAAGRELDGQNGHPEASGVSSAAAMASTTAAMASPAAAVASPAAAMAGLCSPAACANLDEQNGHPEASDLSKAAAKKNQKMGHELLPTILTESRMRKRIHNLSGSNDSSQASIEPKSKRASRSTPGTGTSRKTKSTLARAPFILGSPGALTRRRAAVRDESPEL